MRDEQGYAEEQTGLRDATALRDEGNLASVLVVDDDVSIRTCLGEMLGRSGMRCAQAASVDEARALLHAGFPADLLLIDLAMPGTDGLALLAEIRRAAPSIPCVMMSGAADLEQYQKAVSLDIVEFLHKPVRLRDISRIISALRKSERQIDFSSGLDGNTRGKAIVSVAGGEA